VVLSVRGGRKRLNSIEINREAFLHALRCGKYKKGTTRSDERGRPIVESEADEGWCACALMHDLFYQYDGTLSGLNYRRALDITAKDCRLIQQQWNDKENLSFPEIANKIESEIFAKKRN